MNNYRSLNHTKWECQYHVVFIPKYRRKTLYGGLRHYLGDVLRRLAEPGWRKGIGGSTCQKYSVQVIQGEECDPQLGSLRAGPGTSWGNTSGHGATTSRRSGRMNESCGNTSSSRNGEDRRLEQLRLEEDTFRWRKCPGVAGHAHN